METWKSLGKKNLDWQVQMPLLCQEVDTVMTSHSSSPCFFQGNKACLPSEQKSLAHVAVICRVEPDSLHRLILGLFHSLHPCFSPQGPKPCSATAFNTSTSGPLTSVA